MASSAASRCPGKETLMRMVLFLIPVLALAQRPRTPDGHPGFTGTYNITSLTPIMRPPSKANRKALTDEEEKAEAKKVTDEVAKRNVASDPNRKAPPKGGEIPENDILGKGAGGAVGGYNALWLD